MKAKAPALIKSVLAFYSEPGSGDDNKSVYAMPDFLRAYAVFKPADLDQVLRANLDEKDVFLRTAAAELIRDGEISRNSGYSVRCETVDAGLRIERFFVPAGFRLLQEYLSFRRKFWFVDLHGLDRFSPPAKAMEFQVQCTFDRAFPEEKKFTAENIRLFCAPIVNLFRMETEPIRLDHLLPEYRVFVSVRNGLPPLALIHEAGRFM